MHDLCLSFISLEALFHGAVDCHLVFTMTHVDEVNYDESSDVAEAELACDFFCGFEVGFGDHFLYVFGAFVTAGVDVDSDESFCLIDDEVASTR